MVKNYEKILIYFQFLDNIGMYSNGMLYEYFEKQKPRSVRY
mgnify:CR=1 FL=1